MDQTPDYILTGSPTLKSFEINGVEVPVRFDPNVPPGSFILVNKPQFVIPDDLVLTFNMYEEDESEG